MFPVIFAFGPIIITTLGVMAVLSFFFGSFFIWRKAKQEHIEDGDIFDLIFVSFITGVVGARIGYIVSHFTDFGFSFKNWIDPVGSHGLSWIGLLIGFMVGVAWVSNKKKWEFFEILDLTVTGVIVSQILLRIGQFFDSSFVGSATTLPWGMPFPGFDNNRHPLSIYEIPFLFIFIWLIRYLDKHYRLYVWYKNGRGEAKPGFLWLSYLFGFILLNIFLDFTFIRHTLLLFLSYRQLWLLGLLSVTIVAFWWQAGNAFDVWSLRGKWFGSKEKNNKRDLIIKNNESLTPAKAPIITTGEHAVNEMNKNVETSGKRFFRTRK